MSKMDVAEAKMPLLKKYTLAGKVRKLLTDDDVPSSANIAQPDWMKRQALFKTRRLTNATRINNMLDFDPVKAYFDSMMNCVKYQNEYTISFSGDTNMRSTCALVHRHAGYEKSVTTTEEVDGVDVTTTTTTKNFRGEWAGSKYSDLSGTVEPYTPNVVTPSTNGVQAIYTPWNARFFEAQALKYGVYLPRLKPPVGNDTRLLSTMVSDAETANPHDSQKSPFFNYNTVAIDSVSYLVPNNNLKTGSYLSNILPFDDPNGSCRQRHKNGGVELNCINTGSWPMTVDIVQFKCKTKPSGPESYTKLQLDQQAMYDPVVNIVNSNSQSFNQWKNNAQAGQSEVGIQSIEATDDFGEYKNVHSNPTWKFLATYGGNTKQQNTYADAGEVVAPMNYKEVERKRVVIPASGSYIFKSQFGGMDYNIIDRVNRQFYQENVDADAIPVWTSDIPGETIVTFISVSGLQQPASFTDGELRAFDCTGTPAPQLLVKVREHEELYPWIEIPAKIKPTYTRSTQQMPPSATVQTIVPSTQWVKSV